jgi:lipopolysaccharide transport system ATP-binding protein
VSLRRSDAETDKKLLVELRDVSKRFRLHREVPGSFQETLIRLLKRDGSGRQYYWPVQNVSFSVRQGDSLALIGPNGAGKSTILKLITGILEPTTGDIAVNARISSLLELGAGFHPDLTGRENIFLNGSILGLSRRQMAQRIDSIVDFAELGDYIDVPVKHYSSGMYVRLGFAVAMHTEPELLLVDEVLAVGDAAFQHKCMDQIQKFRENGGTLLLVSHDLQVIQSLCQHVIWLEQGCIQAAGNPTDVVMTYLSRVAQKEEAGPGAASRTRIREDRRWGSGRIKITRVQLCGIDGVERSSFVTSCPLQVRLHYCAEQRVEDPIFGIGIHSQTGIHVTGPNSEVGGLHIPSVEGEGEVVFTVPSLPLMEGAYVLSVSAHNRADSETYDYHDRAYVFRVYPGTNREAYGLVTLNGSWSLRTTSASLPAAEAREAYVSLDARDITQR